MIYIDNIIFCTIIILFPLLVYFLYLQFYTENINKDKLMFSLAVYSSAYLLITSNQLIFPRLSILCLNILIILFYIKDKYINAIILSILLIVLCYFKYKISLVIIIIEFILLFILYIIKKKYSINNYIFIIQFYIIKLIIYISRIKAPGSFFDISLHEDNLLFTFIFVIILNIFIIYIMEIEYKIINYHVSYQELIKEQKVRLSLFKITHEIKNPLAVCKGYLSLLNCRGEKNNRYIEIIKSEINYTISMIEELSYFNKLKIEKNNINFSASILHSISNCENLISEKGITLIQHINKKIYLNCDENRIKQVFINVVKNAIESLDERENKKIIINLFETKRYVKLQVIDNGLGISNKDLKKIGEPFFTTKTKGTGLGIALSKEIIEAHDGKIYYQSKINEGTIVNIKIKK